MNINKLQDGTICHVNFNGTYGSEINFMHLAVVFKIKGIKDLVFCIPLTSPKLKHFKTENDFENRNYLETKFKRLYYIKQTDSIALLEQFRCISTNRIVNYYKNKDKQIEKLNKDELENLKKQQLKYIKNVLFK